MVRGRGAAGRRWREAIVGDDGLRHSLLFESAPDGSFSHLELATPAGLLTLHPEADGTLHGNAIEASGIRHVAGLPWDARGVVDIEGSSIAGAAAARSLDGELESGGSLRRSVLRITAGLLITTGPGLVERIDAETWRVAGGQPIPDGRDGAARPVRRRVLAARAGGAGGRFPVNLGMRAPFVDALWTRSPRRTRNSQTRG